MEENQVLVLDEGLDPAALAAATVCCKSGSMKFIDSEE